MNGPAHHASTVDDLQERRQSVRRALRTGAFIWCLFFGLDIFAVRFGGADAGLVWFALLRLVGLGIMLGCVARLDLGASALGVTAAALTGFGAAVLIVSVMALRFGGLASPYAHGVVIIVVYHAASVPQRWSRSLLMSLTVALPLPLVLAIGAAFHPPTARDWADPAARATLGWNLLLILATVIIGSLAAHSVWAARRQVHEKDAALSAARRSLTRASQSAQHGRLSGQQLGRYLLGDVLGRGGTGEVYRARRGPDGETVAVKVLHPHLVDDVCVPRLRREAELIRRFPPGLVPSIHEVSSIGDQHFIAMEYLRGEDLGTLLRREAPLGVDQVRQLVGQLAQVLSTMHAAGVVHRDLKPQNIFLVQPRAGGGVRLLDFGIARLWEAMSATLTGSDALIGTPGYMAPEQARGDPEIGPPADLFAMGVIAYYALVGERPFVPRPPVVALYETLNITPEPPSRLRPGLPVAVDAVFARALAKDPGQRYPSALELSGALERALERPSAPEIEGRDAEAGHAG